MQRPLVPAIALALTLFAGGCAAPTGKAPAAQSREPERKQDLADRAITSNESDALAERAAGSVQPVSPAPATKLRQEATVPAGIAQLAPAPASTASAPSLAQVGAMPLPEQYREVANRERYAEIDPNRVQLAAEHPVSTFSIDVDTGSFSNVRRQLEQGLLPPADAVRTEEFINWFDYGYQPPADPQTPFSVTTELAAAPWHPQRQLLLIGLKGYEVAAADIPASNLVFLVDTSGSMQSEDKLGLLKHSLQLLAERLRPQDRVAIVAYAGSAGVVLPPTSGDQREHIVAALDRLEAGGSTNGAAGIELAYQVAQENFVAGGVNRVILATDGDFNVGTVSVDALESMVKARRESGIALSTLGFGRDNYNDELAERLADIGNGNHAYIDRIEEGRKVLVEELSSTLLTIAADVKIQIEFNPAVVAEYRLLGYENRALAREDFDNDRVDAGEIGAGHDVTALYEITLVGSGGRQVSPLRYGPATPVSGPGHELAFLKLRYKPEAGAASRLISQPIARPRGETEASPRLRLAAASAAFAELLRGGGTLGAFDYAQLQQWLAQPGTGVEPGQWQALVDLVDRAAALNGRGIARIE